MINKQRVLKITGNIVFYGLLLVFVFNKDAKAWMLRQFTRTGIFAATIQQPLSQHAVSFAVSDDKGNTVAIDEFKGKVVLINFWATWCPPCRAEMPSLQALYNDFKNDDRIVFLFINEDEDRSKVQPYLHEKALALPIYYNATNVDQAIFTGTLPTTVVLDTTGKMVMKHEGVADYHSQKFIAQLSTLLR